MLLISFTRGRWGFTTKKGRVFPLSLFFLMVINNHLLLLQYDSTTSYQRRGDFIFYFHNKIEAKNRRFSNLENSQQSSSCLNTADPSTKRNCKRMQLKDEKPFFFQTICSQVVLNWIPIDNWFNIRNLCKGIGRFIFAVYGLFIENLGRCNILQSI